MVDMAWTGGQDTTCGVDDGMDEMQHGGHRLSKSVGTELGYMGHEWDKGAADMMKAALAAQGCRV